MGALLFCIDVLLSSLFHRGLGALYPGPVRSGHADGDCHALPVFIWMGVAKVAVGVGAVGFVLSSNRFL